MSKYLSTPNKTRTCVYSLGESCSIHWTMRVLYCLSSQTSSICYEFNSISQIGSLLFYPKSCCFDCIFLIPEIHNTIASINYRTTSSIEIAKEISCIVCGFLPRAIEELGNDCQICKCIIYHREIQYHSCTRTCISYKKLSLNEVASFLWKLQLLFTWFFPCYFVKPFIESQYFQFFFRY